jgi:hypothetical protein
MAHEYSYAQLKREWEEQFADQEFFDRISDFRRTYTGTNIITPDTRERSAFAYHPSRTTTMVRYHPYARPKMSRFSKKVQAVKAARAIAPVVYARPTMLQRKSLNEKNFVDLANTSYAADTTGTITLIATIPQNASQNGRVGKRVKFRYIYLRGQAANGGTATRNKVSLIIVYDRRPTGSLPSITDVLVTANSLSFNNDTNSDRFTIVKRCNYVLNGNDTSGRTANSAVDIEEYINLRGKTSVFKAAGTGAIGDISVGALYAITVGDTAAGTAAATFEVGYRTRYTEY